ncbi:MAG: hypothetical protein AYK23_02125 [Candidatus Proteinoplasmatales archaeon SG8-5]|nr:MAG: hypothetical protein AYK23_02125 [Candidatus Proteinoplasmatales archaeon SG8-5]
MVFPSSVIESGNVEVHQIIDTGPGHAAEGFNVHLTCQQNVSTIKPGSSFTYHINVSNTGPVADTIVLTIENPTDWQAHFNNNPAGFSSESEEPKPRASSYRNYSSCIAEILALEAAHPDIVNVTVIGTSWEGRAIPCIKVSDNVTVDEDEPEVLFMGLHHAREWMTVEVPMFFLNHLVDNYGSDPRATWTVKNRETYIVPIVNPDGYVYSQEVQNMWRKNRRDNGDGTWGVDLNRNYDGAQNGDPNGDWGGAGTSHTTSDSTYCGPAPFSEPETQAIRDLVLARDFQLTISYHSYGREVYWPWGYDTGVQTPHHSVQEAISTDIAAINGYTAMQSAVAYPTTGDTDDWVYGHNWYNLGRFISAHTIELDGSFQPPVSQIDATCMLNLDVNYHVTDTAGNLYQDSPVITHVPYQDTYDVIGPYTISANITTPHGLIPGSTKLYWRNSSTWNEVPMVNVAADTWEADIPGQPSGTWISYYIETEDVNNQTSSSPMYTPYATHDFRVGAPALEYPVDLEPNEWRMVNLVVEAPYGAQHNEKAVIDVIGRSVVEPTDYDSVETVTSIIPAILLVNDLNSVIQNYKTALDNNGYSYAESLGASLVDLNDYDVVIWATDGPNPLDSSERTFIGDYLDNGGSLYINGEDIGAAASSGGWLNWYRTYLHANYLQDDSNSNFINGIPGDAISDGLAGLMITGLYPSEITPFDGFASTIFTYIKIGNPTAAIKADTGAHRVVYLACEYFEGSDIQSNKDLLMYRIIEWLTPELPAYDVPVLPIPGWNFISFPIRAIGSIEDILDDSAGDGTTTWDVIRWFDPEDPMDPWKTYTTFMPPELHDLDAVYNTMGLWVHITEVGDGNLTLSGLQPTSTVMYLSAGWNLVGYPSVTSRIALSTLPSGADSIAVFDAVDPYQISDEALGSVVMEPGNAYWVHCTYDDIWIVDW